VRGASIFTDASSEHRANTTSKMMGAIKIRLKSCACSSRSLISRIDACNTRGFHASTLQQGGAIRVIMLDAVPGTGSKGEVVQVKRGYARNFLIPRKAAAYATDDNKKLYEALIATNALEKTRNASKSGAASKAKKDSALAEHLEELQVQIGALPEDWHVDVAANATADGRLYGAIASTDLVSALKDQHNIDCPISAVDLGPEPIKSVGRHKCTVAGLPAWVEVTSRRAAA
jgi:large subunit ribosomal protein L9